jgi:hypothetical protein
MNFESLEQMRYEATQATINALVAIVQDEKADIGKRLEAAKIVDKII